jgi:hypothetical protein
MAQQTQHIGENAMSSVKIMWVMSAMLLANMAIAGMPEIKTSNSQVGVQAVTLNVDYAETDDAGVLLDTEKGYVPGRAIFFSHMWGISNTYFQAQYSRNDGETQYVGGYIGPPPTPYGSVVATSTATISNYSLRLGKGIELGQNRMRNNTQHMLTPYIEVEKQKWFRGVNAGETYYHSAYGAGLLWQMSSPGSKLVTSLNGLVGQTFDAYIDVTGYFSGALGSSPLYKAGLNFDYALSRIIHVNAGIDYARFAYGKSAVYAGYLEPDSTSRYLIYKAGIGISF